MKIRRTILFEDYGAGQLLPLVYWRTIGELRCGYHALMERHSAVLGAPLTDLWVREELAAVAAERHGARINAPVNGGASDQVLLINARYLPDKATKLPRPGTMGMLGDQIAWVSLSADQAAPLNPQAMMSLKTHHPALNNLTSTEVGGAMINYPWDLIAHNKRLLREDWAGAPGRQGQVAHGAHLICPESIFVGPGARIEAGAVLDASQGPIHIGSGVLVSPLAVVQGPACIGEQSLIRPGACIGQDCSIGPLCKLGGEIQASIIQGFSNKQHEGFLGHAYLGQWINLGADTVNSDLKNTYGTVRVPINGREIDSGQTFLGAFIADHAKTGIGQTLSTGSVIGFAANVATSALAPKFIPSFSWLTDQGREHYDPQRCLAVAKTVMSRRKVTMSPAEETLFLRLPALCADLEKLPGP